MAAKIRLMRVGSKKSPFYRIVIVDSPKPRDGKYVDKIGYYDPKVDPEIIEVDREKALDWLEKGATPTDTARALLKKAGIFGAVRSEVPEPVVPAPAEEIVEAIEERVPVEEASLEDVSEVPTEEVQEEEADPEASDSESGGV